MNDLMKELTKPLDKEDVELRIGTTNGGGFSLLLYKTARTDAKRLNDVLGFRWSNKHFYDNKGLLCCTISVYDDELKQWIDRTNVGTESQTEKEKGSYSDSFKRAGFLVGIGAELYNSPFVWIKWNMEKVGQRFKPVNFFPSNLDIVDYEIIEGHFKKLSIAYNGTIVFSYSNDKLRAFIPDDSEQNDNNYATTSKATPEQKKAYWLEFKDICQVQEIDPMEFLESQIDITDKSKMHNTVVHWLRQQDLLRDQLISFKQR